jgi:hypothetical protein
MTGLSIGGRSRSDGSGCANPNPARVLQCSAVTIREQREAGSPSWWGCRQTVLLVLQPQHLKKTAVTALVVGTILFAINALNVVIDGHATPLVWVKAGVTYLVPFAVASVGILIATHHPE